MFESLSKTTVCNICDVWSSSVVDLFYEQLYKLYNDPGLFRCCCLISFSYLTNEKVDVNELLGCCFFADAALMLLTLCLCHCVSLHEAETLQRSILSSSCSYE